MVLQLLINDYLHGFHSNLPTLDYTSLPQFKTKHSIVFSSGVKHFISFRKGSLVLYCKVQRTTSRKYLHKNFNGAVGSETYSQQAEDLLLELQHQAQPPLRSSLAHPHHQIGPSLPSSHTARNMKYFCFYSFILKTLNLE